MAHRAYEVRGVHASRTSRGPTSRAAGVQPRFEPGLEVPLEPKNGGAAQRIIDRGTRSVTMVFRAVVFTFAPDRARADAGVRPCSGKRSRGTSSRSCSRRSRQYVCVDGEDDRVQRLTFRKIANAMDGETTGKAVDALVELRNRECLWQRGVGEHAVRRLCCGATTKRRWAASARQAP